MKKLEDPFSEERKEEFLGRGDETRDNWKRIEKGKGEGKGVEEDSFTMNLILFSATDI